MKGRISFKNGAVQHIYQRTTDGGLIFYSARDYLVLFTVIMIVARKYRVRILGLCFMVDHIHILIEAPSAEELHRFVRDYSSWCASLWNAHYGQNGPLFKGQYGYASKVSDKDIRSAIAYLYNNPVEKQICTRAEQAQWNFLAYGKCSNPFSGPWHMKTASAAMRRAAQQIRALTDLGRPLNYAQLERMAAGLGPLQQKQLTDYIITRYNRIDYAAAASYFGGFDKLVAAINTTKGSEYSIREDFTSGSDRIYSKMTNLLLETKAIDKIDDLLRLDEKSRVSLLEPLCVATGASERKAAKYLHLTLNEGRKPAASQARVEDKQLTSSAL